MTNSPNPLTRYFRQPQLYIKLPSEGKFYPAGSIEIPVTKELPVYAMTAKDEILVKTPDALLTGQSTVDVIQSCVPNIKDAWQIPAVDLDHILISIRRATYGNGMDFVSICPHCNSKNENTVNLEALVNQDFKPDFEDSIKINDLDIYIRPQSFFQLNKIAIEKYEQTRAAMVLGDQKLTENEKIKQVSELLKNIIELGLDAVCNSVVAIRTADGALVEDSQYIREFLSNCDRQVWDTIRGHIEKIADLSPTKNVALNCLNTECKKPFSTPLIFEMSNFFA